VDGSGVNRWSLNDFEGCEEGVPHDFEGCEEGVPRSGYCCAINRLLG